jgi:hypothetical protein
VELTQEQVSTFDRDGFLTFPGLVSPAELEVLRGDLRRVAAVSSEEVVR